jgi:hypothetical protein
MNTIFTPKNYIHINCLKEKFFLICTKRLINLNLKNFKICILEMFNWCMVVCQSVKKMPMLKF